MNCLDFFIDGWNSNNPLPAAEAQPFWLDL
jgi:hypothetical protein